jgi:hypothetical protein
MRRLGAISKLSDFFIRSTNRLGCDQRMANAGNKSAAWVFSVINGSRKRFIMGSIDPTNKYELVPKNFQWINNCR